MEYRLENGRVDVYRASWAIELGDLLNALRDLLRTGARPAAIVWHDES